MPLLKQSPGFVRTLAHPIKGVKASKLLLPFRRKASAGKRQRFAEEGRETLELQEVLAGWTEKEVFFCLSQSGLRPSL